MSTAAEPDAVIPLVDPAALDAALRSRAPGARRTGPWRWRIPPGVGPRAAVRVEASDHWLTFECVLDRGVTRDGGRALLDAGGALPGGLRVALGASGPAVRAEVALGPATDWSGVCREALAALAAAAPMLARGAPGVEQEAGTATAPGPAPADEDRAGFEPAPLGDGEATGGRDPLAPERAAVLAARCAEAGHTAEARASGTVGVELAGAGASWHAAIAPARDGDLRASVEVVTRTAYPAAGRDALVHLLLAAGGAVRHARPWLEERAGALSAGFEVPLGRDPDPALLGRALSALAAACLFAAREAQALTEETLAREYLAARAARRSIQAGPITPSPDPGTGETP